MSVENAAGPLLAGPILYARGSNGERCRLSALVVAETDAPPPLVPDGGEPVVARATNRFGDHRVFLYDFELPAAANAGYTLAGVRHEVVSDLSGDLRIAFVSCNGQENGDEGREHRDRDILWRRLLADHRREPFALLLHGGDQLYADEAVQSHPELARWAEADDDAKLAVRMDDAMHEALRGYFYRRYLDLLRQPAAASLYASVPSLMIWDDHDICDGWGSHPRGLQQSEVGQALFEVAREAFVTFQLGGGPDDLPSIGLDPAGTTLSTAAFFPGFSVHLPDLRSERTPTRVMGEAGWRAVEGALAQAGDGERRIVVSSVPTLGPRMSLLETLLDFIPHGIGFEDDLRDQWQSRAHRGEWRRWLQLLERQSTAHQAAVTVVSGEIHLATRATMALADGTLLHQLVASGITHPEPPAAFARGLGLLSRFGQSPLAGRSIRFHPLPGCSARYTAQRNFLVTERRSGQWTAAWELEHGGRTPALAL